MSFLCALFLTECDQHPHGRGLPSPVFLGFPDSSDGKESACNVGDLVSIPGLGRSPEGGATGQPTPVFLPGEPPRTEDPGRLQSMGPNRVGLDWVIEHSTHMVTRTKNQRVLFDLPSPSPSPALPPICVCVCVCACVCACLAVSDFLQLHRLQPARLLCPWDFPSKTTGAGCHFLFQKIFLTEGCSQMFLLKLTSPAYNRKPKHLFNPVI